jgi:protein-L-isoaspartate(D-aspartate) O-methyltransferase
VTNKRASLVEVRKFYGRLMAAASGSSDPRLERIFGFVAREAFLTPGPWQLMVNGRYVETPSADPVYIYSKSPVALDSSRGVNCGEPYLHAAWLGAVAPQPGEDIVHIGAGAGYYTALLAMLALPGGRVHAFEIDETLACKASRNLQHFSGVSVTWGDATSRSLPPADLIYVCASVVAPPLAWLDALRPGGRVIFPWVPAEGVCVALMLTRAKAGFAVRPFMSCGFVPCAGAADRAGCERAPSVQEAWSVRSVWARAERRPDRSAVAVCREVWFSSAPP